MTFVLPDDPSDWPRNPFELLGVSRDSDSKTVRRAYFKAIRQYKAEKFPAEFQRFQQAHEEAQRLIGLTSTASSANQQNVTDFPSPEASRNDTENEAPKDFGEISFARREENPSTFTVVLTMTNPADDKFMRLLEHGESFGGL